MALGAVQAAGVVLDVVAGDLAEVVVACRPVQQRGQCLSQVAVDGGDVAGTAAGASVFEGAQPAFGVAADPGGHAVELAVQPGVEGGARVVAQQACLPEDPGDVPGGQVPCPQRGQRLRPPGVLAFLAAVQRDGQSLADPAADLAGPPAGLGEAVGDADRGGQGRAGRRAAARAGVRRRQPRLGPGGLRRDGPARAARCGLCRRGSGARCHPVEEQLVMADLHAGGGQGGDRRGRCPFPGAGRRTARSSTAGSTRSSPAAPGRTRCTRARPGCRRGTSGRPGTVSAALLPRPGSRCSCGAGRGPGSWSCPSQGGGRERPSRRLGVTAGPPPPSRRRAGVVPRRRARRRCRARAAAVPRSRSPGRRR